MGLCHSEVDGKKYVSIVMHNHKKSTLLKTDSENCTKWSYNKLKKSRIITKWREWGQGAFSNSISPHPITPPIEDHHVSLPHRKTGTGHRIGVNFQLHFIRILASLVPWKPRKECPKEAVTTVTKDNKMSSPQRPETTYPLYLGLRRSLVTFLQELTSNSLFICLRLLFEN